MRVTIVMAFIAFFTLSWNLSTVNALNTSVTLHKVFQEKISTVKSVEFSPDGKYFLAWGESRPIYVWHVKTFSLYKEIELIKERFAIIRSKDSPSSIVSANFTPNSKSVYAGLNNGTAVTIALDSGEMRSQIPEPVGGQ